MARAALTLCLALSAALSLALVGCASAPAAGPSVGGGPGQVASSTSATPGWSVYRDPAYGFVVEIPSDATAIGATVTGATSLASWRLPAPQSRADAATLEVTATTQASAGVCAHYVSGAPVSLAGGLVGYEQDNLSAPTTTSAASQPQIAVIVLHGGLLSILTLTGQGDPSTFLRRWGAVWSHILATFQPGRGPTGAQPCG